MSVSRQKTIGIRLLRYVFGCYFAITVVVTSIQLFSEYVHVKKNVFQELSHLGETLENSLSKSIWNYNTEQIQATLLGINKISMVSGTKVTDANNEIMVVSGQTADNKDNFFSSRQEGTFGKGIINKIDYREKNHTKTLFEYKFPLYPIDTKENPKKILGYCYIYSDNNSIIERVKYGFILIIVNSLIKTIALWFIFLFFAKRIIAKPLNMFAKATQEFDPSNPKNFHTNSELERIFYSSHDDELHILAESFVKMRNAIIEKFNIIEQQKLTLEQRVKERTASIEEVNRELKHLSLHDALTNLPNRNLFHDRLEHLLDMAKRDHFSFAVASVDLRKFKEINDTFGHQAGDHVLKELSHRMLSSIRGVDTIARMGGDEFAILLKDVDKNSINELGEKIVTCAYKPIIFENESILAGINIGFSIYPDHADNAETLFKNADMAMYQAKKNDNGVALFSPAVSRALERREIIIQDLEKAIDNGQLSVFYQPIVQGKTHQINGVEALLRWKHPQLGFISPDEFISIAERSNIIKTITQWVIDQALNDGEKWQKQGYNLKLSINLSGRLVNDPTFPQSFEHIISKYSFPKKNITLELTESSLMKNTQQAMDVLLALKNFGINLSIDDFGTGYSSFSYLARLPVSELKIDRSFISDFNNSSQMVIETVIGLAHRLQLKVVAEGVETIKVLEVIESFGCDYIQGYHFCRPIPLNELLVWLRDVNQ